MGTFTNLIKYLMYAFNPFFIKKLKKQQEELLLLKNKKQSERENIKNQIETINQKHSKLLKTNNNEQTDLSSSSVKQAARIQQQFKLSLNKKLMLNQKAINDYQSQLLHTIKGIFLAKMLRQNTLFAFLSTLLLCACFIITNINISQQNMLIACGIITFFVILCTYISFRAEYKVANKYNKKHKPSYVSYCYNSVIAISIFLIIFQHGVSNWLSLIFFMIATIMIIYNICNIVKSVRKDPSFYFPVDFPIFNLSLLSLIALYLFYIVKLDMIFNYITTGLLGVICLTYIIAFFWIKKNVKPNKKFGYCIGIIVNLLIIATFIILMFVKIYIIVNIPDKLFNWIGYALTIIIAISSPTTTSLFKRDTKSEQDENGQA